jgi:hypothetical protein
VPVPRGTGTERTGPGPVLQITVGRVLARRDIQVPGWAPLQDREAASRRRRGVPADEPAGRCGTETGRSAVRRMLDVVGPLCPGI